jgi:hypothetical protein
MNKELEDKFHEWMASQGFLVCPVDGTDLSPFYERLGPSRTWGTSA